MSKKNRFKLKLKNYTQVSTEITGVLTPIKWDNKGTPTDYSIFTHDEEDIIIKNYGDIIKLRYLQSKYVIAKGHITYNQDGEKVIYPYYIQSFNQGDIKHAPKRDYYGWPYYMHARDLNYPFDDYLEDAI